MAPRRTTRKGHRSNARGSLIIDRSFRGVGRIARASGTTDRGVYRLYNGMLDSLAAAGRIDILKSIKARTVSFAEVWDVVRPQADRPVELNRLPSPETARRLWRTVKGEEQGALERFVAAHECGELHRKAMRRDARALRKVASAEATVGDLPALMKAARTKCVREGTARTFNMIRTTVQAFLRETVGPYHPLYGAVSTTKVMHETRAPGTPMTPDELTAYLDRVRAEIPDGAEYAAALWSMAITGMRPAEYWGEWHMQADRVRVRGAKQRGQRVVFRDVPLVAPIQPPTRGQSAVAEQLRRYGLTEHTPYDCRRTFARAMEEAGIPRARRKAYLGHGVRDVTDLYERHQVEAYLVDDGAKLRAYFGVRAPGALALMERA